MSVSFESSETRLNLMRAFAGESQARNRYTYTAGLAKNKGLEVLQQVFLFTADQEKEHAEVFYKLLEPLAGQTLHVDGGYPVDLYSDMLDNLKAAAHNENEQHDAVYSSFTKIPAQESFDAIAHTFTIIAGIENTHAQRFEYFAKLLEEDKLFVSDVETGWMCLNCGHIIHSTAAPAKCPVCKHGQGYFIRLELAPYTKIG